MKYLRPTTLGYKDIKIRKSEFVAKTQLLYLFNLSLTVSLTNFKLCGSKFNSNIIARTHKFEKKNPITFNLMLDFFSLYQALTVILSSKC